VLAVIAYREPKTYGTCAVQHFNSDLTIMETKRDLLVPVI